MAKENAETMRTLGAVFAVVLSIVTLELSSYLTRQATVSSRESRDCAKLALANAEKGSGMAREALASSGQVKEVVAGLTKEYPRIEIRMVTTTPVALQSAGDLEKEDFQLYVKNRGQVPVTGLRIQLSAVSGMTHAVAEPADRCTGLEATAFEVTFGASLLPAGFAVVDLRGPALAYLQRVGSGFKSPEGLYHTPINVAATPLMGAGLATAGAAKTMCGDQDLLLVRVIPALLQQPSAVALTKGLSARAEVFPPAQEAALTEPLSPVRETGSYSFVPGAARPQD